MSPFFVRIAAPVDVASIKEIADSNKIALGFLPRARIDEAVQQRRILLLCTRIELVGFVIFRHRKTDAQTTLSDICVAKAWRRYGGGRALVEALIDNCVELGRSFIRLKCPTDLPANHFYEKLGFERIGVADGKQRHLNIWQLNISKVG